MKLIYLYTLYIYHKLADTRYYESIL